MRIFSILQSIPHSDIYNVKVSQCSSPWWHKLTIRCYSKPSKSSAHIRTYSSTKFMKLEKLILFRSLKFSLVLCNPTVHHRVHRCSTLVSIWSQINPVHALPSHYFDILFNIILPLRLFLLMFCFFQVFHKYPTYISLLPRMITFPANLIFGKTDVRVSVHLIWNDVWDQLDPTNCGLKWIKIQQMQQYIDIYSLQNYSTCFGCHSTHHQEY